MAIQSARSAAVVAAALALSPGFGATAQAGPVPSVLTAQVGTTAPQRQAAIVRGVQKELRAHGYDAGAVDGILGERSRAAIHAYQRDAGLPVDGEASRALLDHLKFARPKVNRFGAAELGVVLDIQRELGKRGYYLGPHDGRPGPQTREAARRFARDARLAGDGAELDVRLLEGIRAAPAEISLE